MAAWTAGALGANPHVEGHLDRRQALEGADFVVNTIQVGGYAATQVDFDVPARYGLRYTINDTINVGGVMRGLRTIPVVLDIVRDMKELCPDAWFLNYTNPLAIVIRAVAERSEVKVVGLCHSVFWTVETLAGYLGVPRDEVSHVSAGVNHLAFMLRLEHGGRDLSPDLRAFVDAGRVPDDDLVRGAVPAPRLLPLPSRQSTTPSTTPGSSPRATSWTASTCRSASTSLAACGTSTSTRRRTGAWTPANRSSWSEAASTRR
jgi:alpha-galactosidase/6-phospho-beta-glucosidase family protein